MSRQNSIAMLQSKETGYLDDLGFSPVIRWNKQTKSICGWLLTHDNPQDRDIQVIYIDHDGKIQFGVMERNRLDHNQDPWNLAKEYLTDAPSASTDQIHMDDDSLHIGYAPSDSAESIIENFSRAELREHLTEPGVPATRNELLERLNSLNILDADVSELAALVRLSSAKARQVIHRPNRRVDPNLTSGETSTHRRLTITYAMEPKPLKPAAASTPASPRGLRFADHAALVAVFRGKGPNGRPDRSA
ncbi:MAG: hypothetical protein EYC62_00715 [Alphaproteobacteria bacterium]|nr:MAG: hypothetical protein EYC62_00715 [Alphaproteobacteria bacterium]